MSKKVRLNLDLIYPIDSIYSSSDNTDPSTILGGKWSLVNKEFSTYASYKLDSTLFTPSDNVSNVYFGFTRNGHTITFQIQYTNKVELNDNTIEIGTIDFEAIGISRFLQSAYFTGISDGGNAIVTHYIHATSGVISSRDVVSHTNNNTVPAGNTNLFTISMVIPNGYMLDEKCCKFDWKRTA